MDIVTPAEHAATVREALHGDRITDPVENWAKDDQALAALVALAERATEAEREVTRSESKRHEATMLQQQAEARATELEREREEREAAADVEHEAMVARYKRERERAERAETALRWTQDGSHYSDCRGNACDCASRRARAALGETAP